MNKPPTVSVVMATYNGEKFLREQIDSILNQTYPISELIIQDDCSTDSTPAICREYEAKYPVVHFYENEHNLGFNDNFRTATMRATGDFIALSDQDDVWFPEKIAKQVAAIGNHDMCTCPICRGEAPYKAITEPDSDDVRPGTHVFRCILGHSMLLKRDFAQEPFHWEGTMFYDWSLTLHADWSNGIERVNEVLVFHRAHTNSYTTHQQSFGRSVSNTAPYLHGLRYFRKLQHMPKFRNLCLYINENTKDCDEANMRLQHRLSTLLLSKSTFDYWRLCFLCMAKRKEIYYPARKAEGFRGLIHGFFYPAISAYYSAFNFR